MNRFWSQVKSKPTGSSSIDFPKSTMPPVSVLKYNPEGRMVRGSGPSGLTAVSRQKHWRLTGFTGRSTPAVPGQFGAPGTGAVDDDGGCMQVAPEAVLTPVNPPAVDHQSGHFILDVFGPLCSGVGLVAHEYGVGVEVPVLSAEGAAGQSFRCIQGIVGLDLVRRPPLDLASQGLLHRHGRFGISRKQLLHTKNRLPSR